LLVVVCAKRFLSNILAPHRGQEQAYHVKRDEPAQLTGAEKRVKQKRRACTQEMETRVALETVSRSFCPSPKVLRDSLGQPPCAARNTRSFQTMRTDPGHVHTYMLMFAGTLNHSPHWWTNGRIQDCDNHKLARNTPFNATHCDPAGAEEQ
jgi:hypothetical protein